MCIRDSVGSEMCIRDRAVPTLEPPPNRPISTDKMYPNGGGKLYS
jgi:hypothetical protein